jgi:eukaryotic-like serine/threonine-protein kinase
MKINISTLADRYQIIDLLGEGGSGKTYRALDSQTQTEVAIKVLNLRGAGDWKTLELFEREAKILAQLAHPNIPRYLDYFQTIVAEEESFCLVQEIAPGKSLTAWVEEGYVFSEAELKQIATQILEILIYLQTFTPPIIHRDLNPNNILRSESGIISLVDFGAVRDTYHLTITGGSTIVGTYGYMAPEQFRGQAVLSTDLYGLGTTLLYLKSGQDPADLPVKQMKIDFRERVTVSDRFANWLDRLLEPIPEDRYQNAALALDYLNGKAVSKSPRPKYPIAHISRQDNNLKIVIPPIWFATRSSKQSFIAIVLLSLLDIFIYWLMIATVVPGWLWIFFLVTTIFTIGVTRSIKQTLMITIIYSLPIVINIVWVGITTQGYASTQIMLLTFVPIIIFAIPICRILWHYCAVIMCQREIEILEFSAVEILDSWGSQPRFPRRQAIFTTKLAGSSIFTRTVAVEDIENINCRQVGVLNVKGGIRFEISQARHNASKNILVVDEFNHNLKEHIIGSAKKFRHLYIFGKYLDPAEQHWLIGEISEHLQYLDPRTDRSYPIFSSSSVRVASALAEGRTLHY